MGLTDTHSAAATPHLSADTWACWAEAMAAGLPGFAFRRVRTVEGALTYAWFSSSVEAVLGFGPAEMGVNAQGCLHVIHWADRDRHLSELRRSAEDMNPATEEIRVISRDGAVHWLHCVAVPTAGADGGVIWDGIAVDVTGGRRAELRLDMLMEHAADSILILDDSGRIDAANTAAQTLFAASETVLVGRPLTDLIRDDAPQGCDGQGDCVDTLARMISQGEPGGDCARELTGLTVDGTAFPLELSVREVRLDGRRLYVCIGRDITQRKATEGALRESRQRLSAIAGNMPGMVFQRVMAPDGTVSYTYVSEGCRTFMGIEPEELQAEPELFTRSMSSDERQIFANALARSAQTLEPLDEEMAVYDTARRRRWLRGRSRPNRRADGSIVWDGVMLDVSDRKNAEQRLSFLAYYDPLTRLPNRTAFLERFLAARDATHGSSDMLAVLSLGVDRFGIINATMGHSVGDQVLTAAADIVQAGLGRADVMARASGDRFLVLLADHGSRRTLTEAVERIHGLAQATVFVGAEEFEVSASTGVALFPRDGDDAETLIKNAEAALQRAKTQGPATLQFFTKEMSSKASKTLTLQNRLRRAIEHGEFLPYYQPQVDLVTGAIVGMEALVRWNNPELGMVAPGEFIPVAEESGLIDAICEVMLRDCAQQNKDWQEQGLPAIPVAVNVSGRQFQYARRLIGTLENTLTRSGLDARYLEIELTESSAMRDADSAIAVVQTLKDMGISCAIDDFGTGYSSLSVLKRFPISKLKIDRSFVMDVISDPNDAAIVDAIVAMARALRMKVVAEGVEHTQHLDFLRALGCDQMQGYLFSRPLPAAEMGRILSEGKRLRFSGGNRITAGRT